MRFGSRAGSRCHFAMSRACWPSVGSMFLTRRFTLGAGDGGLGFAQVCVLVKENAA